jgi:prepilin-type N-terminal cleavage/methylation domain-containing protein
MGKKDHHGYSLVELIVVVAIMAVLVGAASVSVGMLSGKQAKQTRDELKAKLENVRILTMGKRTVTAKLTTDASGSYVLVVTSSLDTEKNPEVTSYTLGGSSCRIYYSCDQDCVYAEDGEDLTALTEEVLTLEFDRSSGAMKALSSSDDFYLYHLYVVQNNKVYGIRFYPETGKMEEE